MTRGDTGHRCGGAKRTLDRDELLARREALMAQPVSEERSLLLRKVRNALRNIDNRSVRHG